MPIVYYFLLSFARGSVQFSKGLKNWRQRAEAREKLRIGTPTAARLCIFHALFDLTFFLWFYNI
jgi:hypothetical protein